MLRELGHEVRVQHAWDGRDCGLLLALHCRKSFSSVAAFARAFPRRPRIVVLTGTDLYRDLDTDPAALACLEHATRLIVLQDQALAALPPQHRARAHVVYQSAAAPPANRERLPGRRVTVLGHLRAVKDPFLTARALRHLPDELGIDVLHAGAAIEPEFAAQAGRLALCDARYRWVGELPTWQARRAIQTSWLSVNSSLMEGGANAIAESIVARVPVLATRISGNVGMLGESYPGYFPPGDNRELAALIRRAALDPGFYAELVSCCAMRAPLFDPARERATLARVLDAAHPLSATNAVT